MKSITYHGEVDIEYVYRQAPNPSNVLIVSFPGVRDDDFAASQLGFNYMMTIGSFQVNALYLNSHPEYVKSRMMCINRDFKIERTVKALIDQYVAEAGAERVIAIGSSMGGFCALYYGLQYDWDIIAGALPYSMGGALENLMYACGGTGSEDRKWFNEQIYSVINKAGKRGYKKRIFLSWGEGENNWKSADHGQKLIQDLDAAGISYTYKLYPYSTHTTVHWLFPSILKAWLSYFLGLTDEPQDEEQRSDESKLSHELKDIYSALVPFTETLEKTVPNLQIENCVHYGDLNLWTALRNYVYIQQGWYWGGAYKEPVRIRDKNAFWRSLPREKVPEGVAFWFQDTLLNYYDQKGGEEVLAWCAENARQYLEYICRIADPKHNEHWWNSLRRMHFFIDLHRAMAQKGMSADWLSEIPSEINRDLRFFVIPEISVSDIEGQYRRALGLLHAAVYFKNHTEFFDACYHAAVDVLNKLTDYCFDKNGVCTVMQTRHQSILAQRLMFNIQFIRRNNLPETKELKMLYRKYDAVVECAAHIVRPDGIIAALGHSLYEQAFWTKEWVPRKAGNFIRQASNLAILEDAQSLSYITVNGGSNVHSVWRHCDLLSFTWFYDGRQVFSDSEGGTKNLADFARSAAAHNAFLCDDIDYITPDYNDWTSIHTVDEKEKYVFISMSHMLISGVVMRRRFLWIKPNIIIVNDVAESDAEHEFTQNYILEDYVLNLEGTNKVRIVVQPGFTCDITQFWDEGTDCELKQYRGTTNPEDTDHLRGSHVIAWQRLRKGLNLAYTRKGTAAEFVTAIECHGNSGKAGGAEKSVENVETAEGMIRVRCTGGDVFEVKFAE